MRREMRWAAAVGAVLGLVLATAAAQGQEKGGAGMDLVELTNGTVVVGVLPPLGGRVVLLKTAGGENLLDSDPRLWKPPFPPPAIDTPFKPWNGRIVWVGPQTGFWSQQDLKPDRKKARAGWPPCCWVRKKLMERLISAWMRVIVLRMTLDILATLGSGGSA